MQKDSKASEVFRRLEEKLSNNGITYELPRTRGSIPCIVKVLSWDQAQEIFKYLESIGRVPKSGESLTRGKFIIVCDNDGTFYNCNHSDGVNTNYYMDCGYSHELFKAISAISKDSDEMTWFIWDDPSDDGDPFMLCTEERLEFMIGKKINPNNDNTLQNWHLLEMKKANIWQLMRKFK